MTGILLYLNLHIDRVTFYEVSLEGSTWSPFEIWSWAEYNFNKGVYRSVCLDDII